MRARSESTQRARTFGALDGDRGLGHRLLHVLGVLILQPALQLFSLPLALRVL
jgi:hypothetical protein